MMRCTLARWAISRAADGAGLSSRTLRHIDRCDACRGFQERVSMMGRQLGAGRAAAPAPAELSAPGADTPVARPAFGRRAATWAAVAAAAAIATTVAVKDSGDEPQPIETPPTRVVEMSSIEVDRGDLARDAQQGLRYVLRVSGLPERAE